MWGYNITKPHGYLYVHGKEHPVTRVYTDPWQSLYFAGVPHSIDGAVGRLVLAHRSAVGDWVPIGRYLRAKNIERLLAGRYGLLAEGPAFVVQAYARALSEYGLTLSFHASSQPHRRRVDGQLLESTVPLTTLIIGETYFVAEEFCESLIGEDLVLP